MEVNGYQQLFGYQYSLKYIFLCSTEERNSHRFGTTWRWVTNDRIVIFGWTKKSVSLQVLNLKYNLSRCLITRLYQSDQVCGILRRVSVPLHPALVVRDVFSIEELVWRGVFAQAMLRRRAGVHEGLSHHWQTGVCNTVLVDVKDKLRVFYHVDPKPQRKAGLERKRERYNKIWLRPKSFLVIVVCLESH